MQRQPGAAPEHFEFLATDKSDPRPAFISALCDALGDRGSIVVYHQQFESQRLSDLAIVAAGVLVGGSRRFSGDFGTCYRSSAITSTIRHLAGSYSLKSVLPALVPEMTYDGMEVARWAGAGLAWESLVRGGLDEDEHEKIRKALLDYCGQDTLGMVRMIEIIRRNNRIRLTGKPAYLQ